MVPLGLNPVCHRLHMTVAPASPVTAGRGRGRTGRGAAGRGRGKGGTGGGGGGGRLPSLLAVLAPDRGPATTAYLDDDEMAEWDSRYKLRPEDGPTRRLAARQATGGCSEYCKLISDDSPAR